MLGKSITLHRSADSGGTYGSAIAKIVGISGIEKTRDVNESTEHGGDDWKNFDYGLADGGEVEITARYADGQTEVDALEDAHDNATKEYVEFQFPAPISKKVSGRLLVTKVGTPLPMGDQVNRVFTLKWDGKPVKATLS